MRIALIIAVTVGALAYTLSLQLFPSGKIIPDEKFALPAFTFTTTNGGTYNSRDFKDKIIILNFWASWCAPCVKEFPHLIKAAQEYPDDVVLIALSSDLSEEQMKSFLKKHNIPSADNILIAYDKNQSLTEEKFAISALPVTKIYNGLVLAHEIKGGDWTYDTLDTYIKMLLSNTKNDS